LVSFIHVFRINGSLFGLRNYLADKRSFTFF